MQIETNKKPIDKFEIVPEDIPKYLKEDNVDDSYLDLENKLLPIGSTNGLAFIKDGLGSLLQIHFHKKIIIKNKELTITGNLGEVFKESANVVLNLTTRFIQERNLKTNVKFGEDSFHLHLPKFMIEKDGPSAGSAMFVALLSLFTNESVPQNLALTGEVSSHGEVLAIGGIREKLIACKNYRIKDVIFPNANLNEVLKLSSDLKEGINLHSVSSVNEIYEIVFKQLKN